MQVAVRGWIASMELYHEVYGDKVPAGQGIKGRQINQDSLENVFGCLRGQGGASDNPHAAQVGNHVQRLSHGPRGQCQEEQCSAVVGSKIGCEVDCK